MKKLTCAGCLDQYSRNQTSYYRKKVWCGKVDCKETIDKKVKHKNYKIKLKKINNGTFRSGVDQETRFKVLVRDSYSCKLCNRYDYNEELGISKMQVHHIIPSSEGGSDEMRNLISLCYSCHVEVHRKGWLEYESLLQESVEILETEREASRS